MFGDLQKFNHLLHLLLRKKATPDIEHVQFLAVVHDPLVSVQPGPNLLPIQITLPLVRDRFAGKPEEDKPEALEK
jgi:hypothetical protein